MKNKTNISALEELVNSEIRIYKKKYILYLLRNKMQGIILLEKYLLCILFFVFLYVLLFEVRLHFPLKFLVNRKKISYRKCRKLFSFPYRYW